MKRLLLTLLLAVSLSGCSSFGMISGLFSDDGGTDVNTNAQVGKENTQQLVANQTNTEASGEAQVADQANKVSGTQIINENLPPWVLILIALLAGWAIPSPMEMALGIVNFFRIIFGKEPFKK
jgi:hypothetical protein